MSYKYLISLLALTLFPFLALAGSKPEHCPSVNAINRDLLYFTHVFCAHDGRCGVINFQNLNYDTPDNWELLFWIDDVKDDEEAEQKAKDIMPVMTLKSGPTEIRPNAWSCSYDNPFGYVIHAVNYHGWIQR